MKSASNIILFFYSGTNILFSPRNLMVWGEQPKLFQVVTKKKSSSGGRGLEFRPDHLRGGNIVDEFDNELSHRKLDVQCTKGFVECLDGMDLGEGLLAGQSCFEACNGNCCVGGDHWSTQDACEGFTGRVCRDGSCQGESACHYSDVREIINGCMGDNSCSFAGGHGGNIGKIHNSCVGTRACDSAGSMYGIIGSMVDSCNDYHACNFAAENSGVIIDMEGSCNSYFACYSLAQNGGYVGTSVFESSCNGVQSCTNLGNRAGLVFDTLNNCCNDLGECLYISDETDLPPECTA